MKSKSYKYIRGLNFIAFNDEPEETDVKVISEMISVTLLAFQFDFDPMDVAKDILKIRKKELKF